MKILFILLNCTTLLLSYCLHKIQTVLHKSYQSAIILTIKKLIISHISWKRKTLNDSAPRARAKYSFFVLVSARPRRPTSKRSPTGSKISTFEFRVILFPQQSTTSASQEGCQRSIRQRLISLFWEIFLLHNFLLFKSYYYNFFR